MERFIKLKQEMASHSLREYPRECVGIITKEFDYIPCDNVSPEPKHTFILNPGDLVKHDGNIWGIFHSHPGEDNPIPSKEDKVSAAFQEYKFLVGFKENIFIYWLDENVDALIFDEFKENHLAN